MEKMKLPLRQFLTLIGPAQIIEIKEEETEEKNLYKGVKAKIRDKRELLEREVRLIQPAWDELVAGRYVLEVWVY